MTPVPEGQITSTETWTEPVNEAIKEADAEIATEEYELDEEADQA